MTKPSTFSFILFILAGIAGYDGKQDAMACLAIGGAGFGFAAMIKSWIEDTK